MRKTARDIKKQCWIYIITGIIVAMLHDRCRDGCIGLRLFFYSFALPQYTGCIKVYQCKRTFHTCIHIPFCLGDIFKISGKTNCLLTPSQHKCWDCQRRNTRDEKGDAPSWLNLCILLTRALDGLTPSLV